MKKIAAVADGYLYVVSYLGVTGVTNTILKGKIRETIDCARKYSSLPLIVGFGINTPDQVAAAVKAGADGVIVGSRIVRELPNISKMQSIFLELRAAIH